MNVKRKADSEAVRQARVRQLFIARYHRDNRTANYVLAFFGWLQAHFPELLPKRKQGDHYQHLKRDLNGLYDPQT